MKLTLTNLSYLNSEDDWRSLYFDSVSSLFRFSFGYFKKGDMPVSANVYYSNGDLILDTNNPDANIDFVLSTDI